MNLFSKQSLIQVDTCSSELKPLWIGLLYVYKLAVLTAGVYLTWQTRHVTLPSLRDTVQTYVMVYTVVVLSVMCLPVLLMDRLSVEIRYVTGAMAVWIVTTVTITLLFVPKVRVTKLVNINLHMCEHSITNADIMNSCSQQSLLLSPSSFPVHKQRENKTVTNTLSKANITNTLYILLP